jgi:membrane protein
MKRGVGIAKRFLTEFTRNDLAEFAAALAYRFLFAIFPFGLFVAALTSFVAQWIGLQDPTGQILSALGDNLPSDVAKAIRPELERVIGTSHPELLSIGALGSLWAATGGTNALIKGMNRALEVEETRSFVRKTSLAIGLTLLATLGVLVSFVTIVGGSLITDQIANQFGLTDAWRTLSIIRWPAVGVALTLAVAILYRLAPNAHVPWKWALIGATLFTVGWLVMTAVFAFYLSNIANLGATYGALGGVIALMLWFYLTGLLLLVSAQLIAILMSESRPKEAVVEAVDSATAPVGPMAPSSRPVVTATPTTRSRASSPRERGSGLIAGAVVGAGLLVGAVLARIAGRSDEADVSS